MKLIGNKFFISILLGTTVIGYIFLLNKKYNLQHYIFNQDIDVEIFDNDPENGLTVGEDHLSEELIGSNDEETFEKEELVKEEDKENKVIISNLLVKPTIELIEELTDSELSESSTSDIDV